MRVSSFGAVAFAGALILAVCGTSRPVEHGPDDASSDPRADSHDVVGPADAVGPPDVVWAANVVRPGETPSEPPDDIAQFAQVPEPVPDLAQQSCSPCPSDMIYVDTTFCPDLERRCLDLEYDKINHLPICHEFAPWQYPCRVHRRRIAFCVDRYEYPNRKGARAARMLDWYHAQATCESEGKRLCWASEWTAACEGPDYTPFPYGWKRDHDKCNMDNFYIEPRKFTPNGPFYFYAKDRQTRAQELDRLDQSIPSGSMDSCRSGYGVYDMTGNVDEWVTSDIAPREASRWAGLKGGAWGHVRNQCRAMTFSHNPGFAYYFVGFRCCRDVDGAPKWTPSPDAVAAPFVEPHDFASEAIEVANGPGPSRTKFSHTRPSKPE